MQVETNLASNCLQRLTVDSDGPLPDGRGSFPAWLDELIREHGAGEYLVQVRADGSVVVKRPRKPLEFEWR